MNILHVTPYFAPAWGYGGPPRSVHGLCRELVRRGHAVTVLTTDAYDEWNRAGPPREEVDGIEVLRLPNLSNQLAWRRQLFLPKGIGHFLRDRLTDFDLVHLHMYRTVQDVAVHRYASRRRVPYVFSARGSLPRIVRGFAAKAVFDVVVGMRMLRDASSCVALSQSEKAQYTAMGVATQKIRTIFNGLDWDSFNNLPPEGAFARKYGLEDRRLVAYVGRLNARKGLDYLLHAFRRLASADSDITLVLAGPDDGSRQHLEQLVESLSLTDRVVFTGLLAGQDRVAVFVDSQVIVYPAKHEVFGLAPFEALACGKAVVVADDSGCGEIVGEAQAGFVVAVEDTSQLASAIWLAVKGGPDVSRMVERGRRFVASRMDWDVIGAEMERMYGDAISGRVAQTATAS